MAETPTIFAAPDQLTIVQALVQAKKSIGAVGKNEKNTMQNFRFRGIDSVVNACAPAFIEYGIVVTPEVLDYTYEVAEFGSKRTPMGHVLTKVKYRFHGPAGDFVDSTVYGEATDSGDKATAKAMSVAYRTALLQTLNLPTDEPDPDEQSYERSPAQTTQTAAKPARTPAKKVTVPWVTSADGVINFEETIATVTTTDMLNEVWKKAGELGELPKIKDVLFARGEELKTSKSAS